MCGLAPNPDFSQLCGSPPARDPIPTCSSGGLMLAWRTALSHCPRGTAPPFLLPRLSGHKQLHHTVLYLTDNLFSIPSCVQIPRLPQPHPGPEGWWAKPAYGCAITCVLPPKPISLLPGLQEWSAHPPSPPSCSAAAAPMPSRDHCWGTARCGGGHISRHPSHRSELCTTEQRMVSGGAIPVPVPIHVVLPQGLPAGC